MQANKFKSFLQTSIESHSALSEKFKSEKEQLDKLSNLDEYRELEESEMKHSTKSKYITLLNDLSKDEIKLFKSLDLSEDDLKEIFRDSYSIKFFRLLLKILVNPSYVSELIDRIKSEQIRLDSHEVRTIQYFQIVQKYNFKDVEIKKISPNMDQKTHRQANLRNVVLERSKIALRSKTDKSYTHISFLECDNANVLKSIDFKIKK